MSVAIAERVYERVEPAVYLAADSERDAETRRSLMRLLGSVAVEGTTTDEQIAAEKASLPTVAEDYFSDDPEKSARATARLQADFRTNVFEILCDNGHVSLSRSMYQTDGFYQNGYSQRAMYAHGVIHAKHPVERRRRTAESLNELRIEDGFIAGNFRTHYLVERSRSPESKDMSDEDADNSGYNTKTRKAMLRCTEVDAWGNRITYSAPICGVGKNGIRRDSRGITGMQQQLGLETSDISPSTLLEDAVWVKKELLPNGIVDLVQAYDEAFPGQSFFGVEGRSGEYHTIVAESLERERRIEHQLAAKVRTLALDLRGTSCEAALQLMAVHAKDFATEVCGKDASYDPQQFGDVAAVHIRAARQYAQSGDEIRWRESMMSAQETAIVYMCGMRLEMEKQPDGSLAPKDGQSAESSRPSNCDYISKECPLCHAKNVKTHETNEKITCGTCKQSVYKKKKASYALAA